MSEIERIKKTGLLSDSFFQPEVRSDFFVDRYRKKIWAIELDMLIQFDKVCKKHNLTYCLMYGTLLGAVRHNGFIPWDDDVDVCMPRDDYNKLMQLSSEFAAPYFLQTPYTDSGYFYSYIKIRNGNTTGITTNFQHQNINWGMMLDVYPLDNFVDEGAEERYKIVSELASDNSNYMRMSNPYPSEEDSKRIKLYSGRDPLENYEEIQKVASQFNDSVTELCSVSSLTLYSLKRNRYYKADFEHLVMHEFEGFMFPIPKGYDRILNTLYPNYMELPPIEQRGEWHSNVIFDPEKPYVEYLK